jgi:histo-blood group ABO system transferase
MKIALLNIATNNYIDFVNPFLESADKYFCINSEVDYILFTDKEIKSNSKRKLIINPIEHEPWPMMTLKRYQFFNSAKDLLKKYDYVFYSDIDMKFVDSVGQEILHDLIFTLHPGFYNKSREHFTYHKEQNSLAYISDEEGSNYFAGGFQGGSSEKFLNMCNTITHWMEKDLLNNVIPIWHDESYMNRYAINNPPTAICSPSYCYPENWILPFSKKIIALEKNHSKVREEFILNHA